MPVTRASPSGNIVQPSYRRTFPLVKIFQLFFACISGHQRAVDRLFVSHSLLGLVDQSCTLNSLSDTNTLSYKQTQIIAGMWLYKVVFIYLDHLEFSTRYDEYKIDSRQSSFRLFTHSISQLFKENNFWLGSVLRSRDFISYKQRWWNWGHMFCDFHDFLYQTKASSKFPFINSSRPLKKRNQTPFG